MVIGLLYNVAACIQLFITASPCGRFQMGLGFFCAIVLSKSHLCTSLLSLPQKGNEKQLQLPVIRSMANSEGSYSTKDNDTDA